MIETDKRTKKLLSDPEIFAEIFNHLVFQSDNVLLPENLTPMDSRESLIEPALELYRDVKMKAVVSMKDRNGTAYLILAAENQSSVDRTIPVRTMGYDYLEYRRQLEDMVKHGRKGYLTPVITVVIPWFHTTWKKPRTLHDMFDPEVVEQFKDLIPDYKPVLSTYKCICTTFARESL